VVTAGFRFDGPAQLIVDPLLRYCSSGSLFRRYRFCCIPSSHSVYYYKDEGQRLACEKSQYSFCGQATCPTVKISETDAARGSIFFFTEILIESPSRLNNPTCQSFFMFQIVWFTLIIHSMFVSNKNLLIDFFPHK
jgi:hypothetical protein